MCVVTGNEGKRIKKKVKKKTRREERTSLLSNFFSSSLFETATGVLGESEKKGQPRQGCNPNQ